MPGAEGFALWLARTTGTKASVHDLYEIDDQHILGAGSFGKVMRGRKKASGQPCAVKVIRRSSGNQSARQNSEALNHEISILENVDHPHVVRLIDHFNDNAGTYLVMELCAGGRLTDYIAHMQDFRENDVSFLMQQLLQAIKHLHSHNVIHRDVKLDNMMLESRGPLRENALKLIDFGLSCICAAGSETRLFVGTPDYISPQAIDGCYDSKTDLWSCGVSMYCLLCGYLPFRAATETGVFAAVRRGNFSFAASEWYSVSDDAKALIRWLLKMNPRERCTAEQALDHNWMRLGALPSTGEPLYKAHTAFRARCAQRHGKRTEMDGFSNLMNEVTQWWEQQVSSLSKLTSASWLPIPTPRDSWRQEVC
jgi:calcium-dependent protein kinase